MNFMSNGWGICITCIYRPGCISFQNALRAGRPVWDCYEYDHGSGDECANPCLEKPAAIKSVELANDSGAGSERAKGLCRNCTNRSYCMLPFSEGGIWHCEEYG